MTDVTTPTTSLRRGLLFGALQGGTALSIFTAVHTIYAIPFTQHHNAIYIPWPTADLLITVMIIWSLQLVHLCCVISSPYRISYSSSMGVAMQTFGWFAGIALVVGGTVGIVAMLMMDATGWLSALKVVMGGVGLWEIYGRWLLGPDSDDLSRRCKHIRRWKRQ